VIPYLQMPIQARVNLILAKYAFLGVAPLVIPPFLPTVEVATDKWETQTTTDRAYLKALAKTVGFVFYVNPGPIPGTSIAYFGPDINLPVPQPEVDRSPSSAARADFGGVTKARLER